MILDTNAVSALLEGDESLADVLEGVSQHHLPLMVIAEYQFGVNSSRIRKKLQSLLRRLEADSILLCPDRETADWYISIRYDLKELGTPIPENDLWIAALARQHTLEIVSKDPHFDRVDRLKRIAW